MPQPAVTVANLGFPRIGAKRELKFALETFWRGDCRAEDLLATAAGLRRQHWLAQRERGVEVVPCNDFSLYDQVLDQLFALGAAPPRFADLSGLEKYFAAARGDRGRAPLAMKKWFDTNYHYLVPEWSADLSFAPEPAKPLAELAEARVLGLAARPVLIGPLTLLALGKPAPGCDPLRLLPKVVPAYRALLDALAAAGANWVQIDEPLLVTDLDGGYARAYAEVYGALCAGTPKILLATYFGALGDNLERVCALPVDGLHVDLVRAPEQLPAVLARWPAERTLSLGLVDGRNVWSTDLGAAAALLTHARRARGSASLQIAPSCSLLHVPFDVSVEEALPAALSGRLAFALQKLDELRQLARVTVNPATGRTATKSRPTDDGSPVEDDDWRRSPAITRAAAQRTRLGLPWLPTTTIGSLPQTAEVRAARAAHRRGERSASAYQNFIRERIAEAVALQTELGLDVLVHGEFERADMVDYFAERLEGFALTSAGWVQSYGSRCVKPPILHAAVRRRQPMTLAETRYAQSLSARPVKGMLTGPVTLLQWSFAREDLPRAALARQLAQALREEIADLEAAGVAIVQVDEPAFREGLPLRKARRAGYLEWAVGAFRLATGGAADATQIHTHMCYSEFADILDAIIRLDADVLSIETARSQMALLNDFARTGYPNALGPGVWDIHSPRAPSVTEIVRALRTALAAVPAQRLWVNPDCGLKTRTWDEVRAGLKAMVEAAAIVRSELRG